MVCRCACGLDIILRLLILVSRDGCVDLPRGAMG